MENKIERYTVVKSDGEVIASYSTALGDKLALDYAKISAKQDSCNVYANYTDNTSKLVKSYV